MFIQDLRRAVRVFRLEPGFATAAVLTLALGIGANTALFAVVEAVLLRPLPYSEAGGLMIVKHRDRATGISKEFIAIGDFVDLRARQRSLESLVGYGGMETTLTGDGEPLRVQGLAATAELFDMLRVTPALGRMFTADDSRQGAPPVVVISHRLVADAVRVRSGNPVAIDPHGDNPADGGRRRAARVSLSTGIRHRRDHPGAHCRRSRRPNAAAAGSSESAGCERGRPRRQRWPSSRICRRNSSRSFPSRTVARSTMPSRCVTRWSATPGGRCC